MVGRENLFGSLCVRARPSRAKTLNPFGYSIVLGDFTMSIIYKTATNKHETNKQKSKQNKTGGQ
jgi:hypothetical protein